MSISATRKVSSSLSSPKKTERTYNSGSKGESFVEVIDASNSVLVRDDLHDENKKSKQQYEPTKENDESAKVSSKSTYIPSALEALAASGVYEDNVNNQNMSSHKVGVYDSNQSIIKDEQEDKVGRSYLKHFYEKNEIVDEIDELI